MVKGQGHTYLELVYGSKREFLFHFLTKCVHICHNDCLSRVDYNKSLSIRYDLEIKGQSQIVLKTVTMLIIQTPLWCIDEMCSYLAQQLRMMYRLKRMMYRLKRRSQIADMTLWS